MDRLPFRDSDFVVNRRTNETRLLWNSKLRPAKGERYLSRRATVKVTRRSQRSWISLQFCPFSSSARLYSNRRGKSCFVCVSGTASYHSSHLRILDLRYLDSLGRDPSILGCTYICTRRIHGNVRASVNFNKFNVFLGILSLAMLHRQLKFS